MTWLKDCLLITLLIGIFFGATLGKYPLHSPDGGRYAEIPREMVATGDYITPHLNGIKYFEKPPLFYWLQAISIKAFGVNDLAVSIVNALLALGSVLLVYFIGLKIYNRLSGILASFIFATTSLVFALTRVITLDVAFTFFLTGSVGAFLLATRMPLGSKRNVYIWMMYVFASLAVMTKGLVGIIFPGMIVLIWTIIFNTWHDLKTYRIISGTLIFLLIVLPWHILVQIKNPEFLHFYFIEQHFFRYLTDYANRSQQWWFLPVVFIGGLYPWLIFLPQTIIHQVPRQFSKWQQCKATIFLLIWAASIYIFYTFSNSQLIPYILPAFPPIVVLIGNYLATYWKNKHHLPITIGFNALLFLNIFLGVCAVIAIFTLNFNEQILTKQNIYIVAVCVILGAITSVICYRRRGLTFGFVVLALTTIALWLYISPIITVVNNQSIKPLALTLQRKLQPSDEVICYNAYYQDLPFYLQRRVAVADYKGELAFGMQHQDTSAWMIDSKEFWRRWHSDKKVYLITTVNKYHNLQSGALGKMLIVDQYQDYVLIQNIK